MWRGGLGWMLGAAWACGCTAVPAGTAHTERSIVNGTPTTGDLSVVALVSGSPFCTGVLVSPRHVLTAGHCGQGLVPGSFEVFFGSDPVAEDGVRVAAADVIVHPDFVMNPLTNDVSVILLAQPAPEPIAPSPMMSTPFDATFTGRTIRLVGFGSTGTEPDGAPIKREGTTLIESFTELDFRFGPMPSQTCRGDSGGPAFLDIGGVEHVVGTTTAGDPDCAEFGRDTRTDAYLETFIEPYLVATAEGAAGAGDRCFYAEHCGDGECTEAADEPRLSFCAIECAARADCPPGQECVDVDGGVRCRWPEPTPGSLGAACADGTDCLDRVCAGKQDDPELVCTRPCSPLAPMACPDGFACQPADGLGHACFAEPGGCSCAASGRRAGDLAAVAAAALIAVCRRRRRRALPPAE